MKIKLKLLFLLLLMSISLFSLKAMAAEAPDQLTLYVKDGILSFEGSASPGQIQGNAIIESGNIPNPGWTPRVYDGLVYYLPGANFDPGQSMSPENRNSFVPLDSDPYTFSPLEFAPVPVLSPKGNLKTEDEDNYTQITEDGWYGTIEVANNGSKGLEIVAGQGEVRKIRIDTLILNGQIVIKGNGKVILYIEQLVNTGVNNPSINVHRTSYSYEFGETSQCAVYFYGDNKTLPFQNMYVAANIYSKNSTINMTGSNIKVKGNIYAQGRLIMGASCDVYGYVYAPDSDVSLAGNSTIYGMLVAKTLAFNKGSGKIRKGDIYEIDREVCPSGDGLPIGPDPFAAVENGILGTYYDSHELINSSAIRMMRIDKHIAFNWKMDSPEPCIERETFGVRWTGFITVPKTGDYLFRTYSDDGVKLTVDNKLLINRWGLINLEFTTASTTVHLEKGKLYPITLEYQQIPLNSTVFLFWEADGVPMQVVPDSAYYVSKELYNEYKTAKYLNPIQRNGNGLKAEFFDGPQGLDTSDVLHTEIGNVDYHWGANSPGGIQEIGDTFSTRIEGFIEGKFTETINLQFITDDGLRVWFDGVLVIDSWQKNNYVTYTAQVNTIAGHKHSIKIEHCDLGESATLMMRWYSPSQQLEVVPKEYLYTHNN